MIEYTTGNIFESNAEAYVNPVNCVGVMGKGLALQFKQNYPQMFRSYEIACIHGQVDPGKHHVYCTGIKRPAYIINFPTKRHWRDKSRLIDITYGLRMLNQVIAKHDIKSIALPPLGCGLGGLPWNQVGPIIERILQHSTADRIIVYEPAKQRRR